MIRLFRWSVLVGHSYCAETLNVALEVMRGLLVKLDSLYPLNPYHNTHHAAAVAHVTAFLACQFDMFSRHSVLEPLDDVTVILAALGHDGIANRKNFSWNLKTLVTLFVF